MCSFLTCGCCVRVKLRIGLVLPPLSLFFHTEKESKWWRGVRTNRLYNISENITHCPLCVLPDRNKDCHYWFVYVCVSVEWMQIHSCPCTGSLLFTAELRTSSDSCMCVRCVFWLSLCACLFYLLLDRNMETHQDRLCASYRQTLSDTTQKLERYLVSAWVNARAPGHRGQLPSFKGKATMVYVKGTVVVIFKASVSSNIICIL